MRSTGEAGVRNTWYGIPGWIIIIIERIDAKFWHDDWGGIIDTLDEAESLRVCPESYPYGNMPFADFRPRCAQGAISRKPRVSADC